MAGYRNISTNPPLVDEMVDQNVNPINPTLVERESHEFILNQSLVEKMVDSIPPLVDCTFPIDSELHTAQVLLIFSGSNEMGGNPLIPIVQGDNSPIPMAQRGNPLDPQHRRAFLSFP